MRAILNKLDLTLSPEEGVHEIGIPTLTPLHVSSSSETRSRSIYDSLITLAETKPSSDEGGKGDNDHPPPDDPIQPPLPPPTPLNPERWYERMALTDWIIAVATVVIAVVGYFQYQEMAGSGTQTDRMIRLYRSQVAQLSRQAGDTHDLAVAAKQQAEQALTQANATKKLAESTL